MVDLSKLSLPRLKKLKRSLYAKVCVYENCGCGCSGCDYMPLINKNNPRYRRLKFELRDVIKEYYRRVGELNKEKNKKNWALVPTVKELVIERK